MSNTGVEYERGQLKAYANSRGWQHIAYLSPYESIDIDVNGYWYSGRESFCPTGGRHYDRRHPFPNNNAMAMIIRVKYNSGAVSYHTLSSYSNSFGTTVSQSAQVSWMINDWQRGGLGDNSGYLNLYYSVD